MRKLQLTPKDSDVRRPYRFLLFWIPILLIGYAAIFFTFNKQIDVLKEEQQLLETRIRVNLDKEFSSFVLPVNSLDDAILDAYNRYEIKREIDFTMMLINDDIPNLYTISFQSSSPLTKYTDVLTDDIRTVQIGIKTVLNDMETYIAFVNELQHRDTLFVVESSNITQNTDGTVTVAMNLSAFYKIRA